MTPPLYEDTLMYTANWRKPWQLANLLEIALPSLKRMQIPTKVTTMSRSDRKSVIFCPCNFAVHEQTKQCLQCRIELRASCVLLTLHHHIEGAHNFRVQPNVRSVCAELADLWQLNVLLFQLTSSLLEDGIHNLGICHTADQHECT